MLWEVNGSKVSNPVPLDCNEGKTLPMCSVFPSEGWAGRVPPPGLFQSFSLKSIFLKKILEKPFSTQNLQKLPRHLALISWGIFCKFCVLNGFSRI